MDSKLEHDETSYEPTDAKALKRLENMFDAFTQNCNMSLQAGNCVFPVLDGVKRQGNAIIVDGSKDMHFKGVECCSHCAERVIMYLRDTANTLEEILEVMRK